MERAIDTEPSGEAKMPNVHDLRDFLDATGAGNAALPTFARVGAAGLDFAPASTRANAPLNPLVFALSAPDFPGAPETNVPVEREPAGTGTDMDAARGDA